MFEERHGNKVEVAHADGPHRFLRELDTARNVLSIDDSFNLISGSL